MLLRDRLFAALFGEGGLLRVRAGLAFILTGAVVYLWINGDSVPDALLAMASGTVAYYFGNRAS